VDALVLVPVLVRDAPVPVLVEVDNKHMLIPAIQKTLQALFRSPKSDPQPLPGLFHYTVPTEYGHSRVHLRVDENRSGSLLVNANRLLYLNPTAVHMAFLYLEDFKRHEAVRVLRKMYGLSTTELESDYLQFITQIHELIHPDGACPIHNLDLEITPPHNNRPSAPYRMDLALTYRCNNDCTHCYNGRPRDFKELSTSEWLNILDKLWEIGIPHIVFTGGEPTLRDDLPELIAHAEQNGQITGINTNGRRLAKEDYVNLLVQAGLDHVQITLESHEPKIHNLMVQSDHAWAQTIQGIRNAVRTNLYTMTNTTLLRDNAPYLGMTLDFLAELNVKSIGLNALIYAGHGLEVGTGLSEFELQPLLELARQKTETHDQRLIWYTPTQYCHFDPVQLELGVKSCTAASYSMCIEPNGDVIPCQSYYQTLGNIIHDPWTTIWHHPLAESLRCRKYATEDCQSCLFLNECGGGCPLHPTEVKPITISHEEDPV
jgi:radical SAM protein with 4Fe4S-binding SPASM domain